MTCLGTHCQGKVQSLSPYEHQLCHPGHQLLGGHLLTQQVVLWKGRGRSRHNGMMGQLGVRSDAEATAAVRGSISWCQIC
jgi:hypothetical protein